MGGKSAYGRNRKHYYYEHPRKLAKDGVTHAKRCRLERVRAEKMEAMVLGFLRELLAKPERIDDMVQAYSQRMASEIPALEGRLKSIANDLRQTERKIENLVARLSELPKEISAEPIYRQLKALNEKLDFLKETRTTFEAEKNKATTKAIDQGGLKQRIQDAVSSLQTAPKDKQRPIFANVIHFAELHPIRVRLGLYAPLMRSGSTRVRKWCGWRDLNPHGFPHMVLSHACLPFHHSREFPYLTFSRRGRQVPIVHGPAIFRRGGGSCPRSLTR